MGADISHYTLYSEVEGAGAEGASPAVQLQECRMAGRALFLCFILVGLFSLKCFTLTAHYNIA